MVEYSILRIFVENNELYEKYHSSLKLDFIRQNYPVLHKVFKCLPANSFDALEANYLANYPVLKDGDRDTIRVLLDNVKAATATEDEIIPYLESHLQRVWASDVGIMGLEVAEGKKKVEELDAKIAERSAIVGQ